MLYNKQAPTHIGGGLSVVERGISLVEDRGEGFGQGATLIEDEVVADDVGIVDGHAEGCNG